VKEWQECRKTSEENDRNMRGMLRRCQDTGLKLNPDKCFVKQEKIRFYGVVCSQGGIQPDPKKMSALKQMSAPTSGQELQTFLGLANYNPTSRAPKGKTPI